MILPKSEQETLSGGIQDSGSFSIDDQDLPIILDFLRSKLYTDKHGAVVREIASNSRDAHRAVGTPTRPIEISLLKHNPFVNASDSAIAFKDYGPGISPTEMHTILTKYGKSTKRDSNDFTGGLGLGSKSPFSLVDQFIIESVKDGQEYVYSVFIDETKKGKFSLLLKGETERENQTTVIIPIDVYQLNTWVEKINYYFSFWEIPPVLTNLSGGRVNKPEILHETDDWAIIMTKSGFNQPLMFLLDDIPYPLQSNKITPLVINNYCVLFKFKTGELNVTISRENLEYDELTVTNIKKRQEEFNTYFIGKVNSFCSKFQTRLEAIINYNGKLPFTNNTYLNQSLFSSFNQYYNYKGDKNKTDYSYYFINSSFIINDTKSKLTRVNQIEAGNIPEVWCYADSALVKRKLETLNSYKQCYGIIVPNKKRLTEGKTPEETAAKLKAHNEFLAKQAKEIEEFLTIIEVDPKLVNFSTIPNAPMPKRVKSLTPKVYKPQLIQLRSFYQNISVTKKTYGSPIRILYDKKTKTFSSVNPANPLPVLIPVINSVYYTEPEWKKLKLFAFLTNAELVQVTEIQQTKLKPILTPITELISNLTTKDLNNLKSLHSFFLNKKSTSEIGSAILKLDCLKDKVKSDWDDSKKSVKILGGTSSVDNWVYGDREILETIEREIKNLTVATVDSTAIVAKLQSKEKELHSRYPLLKHIDFSNATELPNLIKNYIALVDKEEMDKNINKI